MLKPLGFVLAKTNNTAANVNITAQIAILFLYFIWSIWNCSPIISLKALNAVSPDVIGSTITPIIAKIAPMFPRNSLDTIPIIKVAPVLRACPLPNNIIAPAAHTIAIKPSINIMLKNVVLPSFSFSVVLEIIVA